MEEQHKLFEISVKFNRGLEPLTLSVEEQPSSNDVTVTTFKVSRYEDIFGIFSRDGHHNWKQVDGTAPKDEVDAIGAAIDAHYGRF
ncbi:hypothetical protein [Pedobacter steynii]